MTKIIRIPPPNTDLGLSIEFVDDGRSDTMVYGHYKPKRRKNYDSLG